MGARKSSKVNRKYKTRYRVGNWPEYERGLRARGDVTVWVSDEAIASWTPEPTGRRGGQSRYSSLAILTALTLRLVFRLPLRQTEGFVGSLLRLMGLELNAPDHTTLSRRGRDVEVPPLRRDHDGPIHLVVDSTGLKVFGAGEWSTRKHGKRKLRRGWRKLHIGVDGSDFIVAGELTKSDIDDASMVPKLLESIDVKLRRFTGDGAYDQKLVYDKVGRRRRGGTRRRISAPRESGRRGTRTSSESRRSVGSRGTRSPGIASRRGRRTCGALNRMFELGKPESYAVTT